MVTIAVDKEEFVRRCEDAYATNRESLEKRHASKVIALYEGGVAGVGNNVDAAYREAIKKHPHKIFYFRRVGQFPAAGILF